MIEFKCIYCGQRISAQEDECGQKGKCPKCNHDFFVPKKTEPKSKANRCNSAFTTPEDLSVYDDDVVVSESEFYRENFKWLIPTYDELSLFLMAFTLIMLLIANTQMREQVFQLMANSYYCFVNHNSSGNDFFLYVCFFWVAILFFLYGFGLSIYYLYATKEKTNFEKEAMLTFAVFTNICTAFAAGIYMLRESTGWTIIFPIWNLINAGLLLEILHRKMIDKRCLSDRYATFHQIIISLTAVFIVFIICNFIFKFYWAITFSICIIYTNSFDKALQSVFPGLTHREDEKVS